MSSQFASKKVPERIASAFVASYQYTINGVVNYISIKNTLAVKKGPEQPRIKKGLGKKGVKSKWEAKACAVLLLMETKF